MEHELVLLPVTYLGIPLSTVTLLVVIMSGPMREAPLLLLLVATYSSVHNSQWP